MPYGGNCAPKWIDMLKYDENLDGFVGDDEDDEKVINIDDLDHLIDADESDEDTEEPIADDFAEDFINDTNMSDIREEILFTADDDFWRAWIENKEMLAQAKDCELAKRFWDERP